MISYLGAPDQQVAPPPGGCLENLGSFHFVAPPFSACGLQSHWKEKKEPGGWEAFMGQYCSLLRHMATPDCKGFWEM